MIFEDSINSIIVGDCLEVMAGWPDDCVDLVVTSPPYNTGKNYDNYDDNQAWGKFIEWNQMVLNVLLRISKHVVWIIGSHNNMEYFTRLRSALETLSTYKVIYAPRYLYMNPVELAIYLWRPGWSWKKKHKPPLLLNGQVVSWMPVVIGREENLHKEHPASFPERYAIYFIESFTEPGDIVLDPFVGSGTTANVANRMDRKYIGIDISEKYCELAKEQIVATTKGISVNELRKGQKVFWS